MFIEIGSSASEVKNQIRNQQVAGSNPIAGSNKIKRLAEFGLAFLFYGGIFCQNLAKNHSYPPLPLPP